ncbi:MAG TPA: molybdopterin-binding protein [Cyanobacteria bacterium UBA12227]|nr:molybdopterin-binding protein [Cyanobacteria bacterium UBA12227]HAX89462.1 molybdopterin-binding protein [Cyanobacteria bacterium UBA11370]
MNLHKPFNIQNQLRPATLTPFKISFTLVYLILGTYLTGCSDRPTDAELERQRQEAIVMNAEAIATQKTGRNQKEWELVIGGQTTTGKSVRLSWSELEALATTSIWTQDPHNTNDPDAIVHFHGIAVSRLLNQLGVAPHVKEVTFVADDAYRSTVNVADLYQYPIIIALERNTQKISRSEGGPLYLVFPHTEFPQLQSKYPDRFWAFYVTDIVIGTEPIQLRLGKRVLDASALEKLPPVTLEETVGYPLGWPASKVKLHGVLIRDVLAAAGLQIPNNSYVIVRGKSPIYRDPNNPVRIKASDIRNCDILLATRWGDDRIPISATMGGPVTLAISSSCQTQLDNRRWVTFVEELEVAD